MKRVMLIINPHSGKLKNKATLYDIIKVMSDNDALVTTCFTKKEGDALSFSRYACDCGEYDLIVCSGGDGTLNETVAGITDSENKLPLGYIPSGSTNDYARSVGIPSNPRLAAKNAVCGHPHSIDVGDIDNRHFNYIASFGAFTSASYNAPQSLKNLMGHMAYVLAGLKDFGNLKSTHVKIECEDNSYEGDYIFGAITNTTSIGGIVKLDDNLVGFNDGLFEVCLVKTPQNPADAVKIIMGALNSDFSDSSFEFFKASSLEITVPDKTPWSLDGEKYVSGEKISVKIIKSAITLLL